MFEFMLGAFLGKGINVHEVLIEDKTISGVDQMEHELLNRGIYAIINKQLNMDVGETQRNFLIRWIEHLMSINKYEDEPKRIHLYLNQATKFIVLKKMDSDEYSTKDFYKLEYDAQNFYIQKGWDVLSSVSYNPNRSYSDLELTSEKLLERYRKAVKHMAYILSTVNTKHKNGSFILSNLYKKVEKLFKVGKARTLYIN